MTTPAFPPVFTDLNLDEVNQRLRDGRASESDARQLVEWWNHSGKRLTVAKLIHVSVTFYGCACLAPQVVITDTP